VKLATPPSEVVVLTPTNFEQVVLDSTKDVLVEFSMPLVRLAPRLSSGSSALHLDRGSAACVVWRQAESLLSAED